MGEKEREISQVLPPVVSIEGTLKLQVTRWRLYITLDHYTGLTPVQSSPSAPHKRAGDFQIFAYFFYLKSIMCEVRHLLFYYAHCLMTRMI